MRRVLLLNAQNSVLLSEEGRLGWLAQCVLQSARALGVLASDGGTVKRGQVGKASCFPEAAATLCIIRCDSAAWVNAVYTESSVWFGEVAEAAAATNAGGGAGGVGSVCRILPCGLSLPSASA